MNKKIHVSTPSRICLFGEHQDYLGLEVIAAAIDLRFSATIKSRSDSIIYIKIDSDIFSSEGMESEVIDHTVEVIDISKPIVYENNRDYLKSTVNLLLKKGYKIEHGYDIYMNSEIPIGKGMSSSTTMIIVLIKAILEALDSEDKDNVEKIAYLGYLAEVEEFNEPGGMMDHYSSAVGGLLHINFAGGKTAIERVNIKLPGSFILFDSLEKKDTTRVLANSKHPVIRGLKKLEDFGIKSICDFVNDDKNFQYLDIVNDEEKAKIVANIENYKILKKAEKMLVDNAFSMKEFGDLIKKHHANLRDGLNISTERIEEILECTYKNGALGGKVNGSGGGGCCFVYVYDEDCEKILDEVKALGYPGKILKQDSGVRKDLEEIV